MISETRISVCMATYNGAPYIREQIASILPQLGVHDELVIVDDASSDETVEVIKSFHDSRIRLFQHFTNRGVVTTFERALHEASGDLIFLADQDDVWRSDKIATMTKAFEDDSRVTLVISDGEVIDATGQSMSRSLNGESRFSSGVFSNLIRNRYQGSAMAFRWEILEAVLPMPAGIPMHDSWIGLVNAALGKTAYLPDRLLLYRKHDKNVTPKRHGTVARMASQRWRLASNLLTRSGAIIRVRQMLRDKKRSTSQAAEMNHSAQVTTSSLPRRAVVFAPFFCGDGVPSRPGFVASVLVEMMPVDIVTSDFDHSSKTKRESRQSAPYGQIIYLTTLPYPNNVGLVRLLSHVLLSIKAAMFFMKTRRKYNVVYVTAPLNSMAWLVFTLAGSRTKIMDVIDIWPDVLPFPRALEIAFWPVLKVWKWFFKSAVAKADIVMAVSDVFAEEAKRYVSVHAKTGRFYIGHERLAAAVEKQPIFTIAYVGNLGRVYDYETLIDVITEQDIRDSVQLFIIGRGDRQEWLIGELEKRKIRYRFFGAIFDQDSLAQILRGCHIGFNGYFSTSASFSYKACTYLAAGLPMLNSMTGDLGRIVSQHGLGENYKAGDRNALKQGLLRLMCGGADEMAAECDRFYNSTLDPLVLRREMMQFLAPNPNIASQPIGNEAVADDPNLEGIVKAASTSELGSL